MDKHDQAREVPPLSKRHARALAKARRLTPAVREGLAYALAGASLRDAADRVSVHPSTLHEALRRHGLADDWKRTRQRTLKRVHSGKVPAWWRHHFEGAA